MSWIKLLKHDLRCGLFRSRYFITPILFILPCIVCRIQLFEMGLTGTIGDYLLFVFEGKSIIMESDNIDTYIPVLWLLIISGCLLINLDYLLDDMTHYGLQIMVRSKTRVRWFVSKCIWNAISVLMYYLVGILTIVAFAVISGSEIEIKNTPVFTNIIYNEILIQPISLTMLDVVFITIVAPCVTVAAISMIEMALCTIAPPVVSFILCICQIFIAFYVQSPYGLGNGAMSIRSSIISESGISTYKAVLFAVFTLILAAFLGTLRMQKADILGSNE